MNFLKIFFRFQPFHRKWLPLILITPLLICCGCQAARRNGNNAEAKIIPGESAGEKFQAVQILYSDSRRCSGTFTDTRHFLTAAHCLINKKGEVLAPENVKVGSAQEVALRIDIHSGYKSGTEIDLDYDIGIVTFSDKNDRSFAAFSRFQPRLGDVVTMVGYGVGSLSDLDDVPKKRFGTNKISQFRDSAIFIDNDSRESLTDQALLGPGDSGSGIFDTRGELIAVGISGTPLFSRAILVSSKKIRDFLIQFSNDAEPGN